MCFRGLITLVVFLVLLQELHKNNAAMIMRILYFITITMLINSVTGCGIYLLRFCCIKEKKNTMF